MSLPENWEKTTDKSGRIDSLQDKMKKAERSNPMSVVLRYEMQGELGVEQANVSVIMEYNRGEFEYYWRFDDHSGELEYEYQVFGDTNSSFDNAKSAAVKKVNVEAEK